MTSSVTWGGSTVMLSDPCGYQNCLRGKKREIRTENAEVVGHLELFGELASMFYLCEVRSIHCPPPFDPFKDWMSYKGAWDCRVALRVAVKLW